MVVWAQSSQRATCPPRAAVRQLSIALITFSWARLTWPRLARRQAALWSRKMSATSRAGRTTSGGLRRRLAPPGTDRREPVQRARDLAQHLARHVRVTRRRVELGMP